MRFYDRELESKALSCESLIYKGDSHVDCRCTVSGEPAQAGYCRVRSFTGHKGLSLDRAIPWF